MYISLKNQEIENKKWEMYLTLYPFMMVGQIDFIEFDKFKDGFNKSNDEVMVKAYEKTDDEIDKEIQELDKRGWE